MPDKEINWDLLIRYISGSMTSEEAMRVSEWIKSDPDNETFLIYLRKIWDNSASDRAEWNTDASWSRFRERYDLSYSDQKSTEDQAAARSPSKRAGTTGPVLRRPTTHKPATLQQTSIGQAMSGSTIRNRVHGAATRSVRNRAWYSWTAVAAVTVVVLIYSLLSSQTTPGEGVPEEPIIEMREVVTRYGQRTHLNLSDGSRVILNAGSRLVLPEYFRDEGPREVFLSGEAYFEVADDTTRPFYVFTDESVTRVVGTKFKVQSYPDGNPVQVVVSEGEVRLQDRNRNLVATSITMNRMGVLSGEGTVEVTDVEDISIYFGWIEGRLIFNREPLRSVIPLLERWYDIRIETDTLAPELFSRELTAEFSQQQPLEEVLEAIAITLEIDYTKQEGNSRFEFLNTN